MKQKQNFLKIIPLLAGIFVFLTFAYYSLNFRHTHYLSDGSVIVHSHPYSKGENNKHHHSENEIIHLALINHQMNDHSIQSYQFRQVESIDHFKIDQPNEFIRQRLKSNFHYRGPPSC